jgi:hypothetical protein
MGESPEGRQMQPNGFPTFSKTSQRHVSEISLKIFTGSYSRRL